MMSFLFILFFYFSSKSHYVTEDQMHTLLLTNVHPSIAEVFSDVTFRFGFLPRAVSWMSVLAVYLPRPSPLFSSPTLPERRRVPRFTSSPGAEPSRGARRPPPRRRGA